MRARTLSEAQLAEVEEVAALVSARYEARQVARDRFSVGSEDERRRRRFDALAAEYAVALELGERWNRGDPLQADVGTRTEVRWTSNRRSPELRVYAPENDRSQDRGHLDRPFWLTTGRRPTYQIHGWLLGRDVVRLGERRPGPEGASYFVPAAQINVYPAPTAVGTPLGPPRTCPSCGAPHPPGTSCAGGAWPWVLDEEL